MLLVGPCDHCEEPSCNSLLWIWTLMLSRANQLLTAGLRFPGMMRVHVVCEVFTKKANTFYFVVGCLEAQVCFYHSDFHFKNPDVSVKPTVWRCSLHKSPCCYRPDISVHLCAFSAVGRMWHTGRGSVALSDPGKLCHPVIIPSLPVCSQPAHRGGGHHHGDRLSGLCWSCQRESSSAADGKSFWRRAVDLKTPWHWRRCNVLELMLRIYRKKTMLTSLTIVNSTSWYFGAAPWPDRRCAMVNKMEALIAAFSQAPRELKAKSINYDNCLVSPV